MDNERIIIYIEYINEDCSLITIRDNGFETVEGQFSNRGVYKMKINDWFFLTVFNNIFEGYD